MILQEGALFLGINQYNNMSKIITNKEFIEKSNKIYNNKYDYSKTKYVLSNTKVIITCLEHGDFNQTPGKHMVNYIKKH